MSHCWPLVPLKELLQTVSRPENVIPNRSYRILGAHWYAQGLYVKNTTAGSGVLADRLYRVQKSDFVYNRLFAWKGSFALATNEHDGCYVSNEFPCFNVDSKRLDGRFLWRYFSRPPVWNHALAFSKGGTPTSRNRLKEDKFLAFKIPLPHLDEQRRIVARIEALAAKIDEACSLRSKNNTELASFVRTAADTLLDSGRWPQLNLGTVLRDGSQNGLAARPSDSPPGLPILRISAATSRGDAIIDEQDFKYLQVTNTEASRYTLLPGDLLACRFNGNLHFVGRFALYEGQIDEPRLYPDKLIRFRVDPERALPQYVRIAMNSGKVRRVVESFCATTAGNLGISATNLKAVPLPLPPVSEQRRIVAYLDGLQVKVDMLKRLQVETAAELDALLPSILDAAFRGKL